MWAGRRLLPLVSLLGLWLGLAAQAGADVTGPEMPDLGSIRYRDPHHARRLWLGLEVGGIGLPKSLKLLDPPRTVWTVRTTPSWALGLTPWLTIGGRHSMAWYGVEATYDVLLRIHEHQLEISGRPLASRSGLRMHDRLSLGYEGHDVENSMVGGEEFRLGGLKDTILSLSYGIEHLLGERWAVGWGVSLRYVWVFADEQRQIRASARASFWPRPPHELRFEAIGYYVNRNEDQAGNPLPEHGVYAQLAMQYTWLSRFNVGPTVRARFASTFLSGEAPVYEIREESLNNVYGDITVGLRAVWD